MTGLLDRAAGFFVVREPETRPVVATVPTAARVIVLGAREDVPPLAAAVALRLRAADGAAAAVVAVWTRGDDPAVPGGPATPGASRLAARLARREAAAVARGRLVWLRLPGDPHAAEAAVRRIAATVDAPVVTALAGARPAVLDTLVGEHELVVLATEPTTPLAEAAVARLRDTFASVLACRPLGRGPARTLALAGLAAPNLEPPLRAAPAR